VRSSCHVSLASPESRLLDGLGDTVGNVASDAWHGLEKIGAEAINDLASLGNAVVHHPGDIAGIVGARGWLSLVVVP
jgi:hypothetical protein